MGSYESQRLLIHVTMIEVLGKSLTAGIFHYCFQDFFFFSVTEIYEMGVLHTYTQMKRKLLKKIKTKKKALIKKKHISS